MKTVARYWSAFVPLDYFKTAEEAAAFKAIDHKLDDEAIIEMQTIDADCNDCRHFKRGQMVRRLGHVEFQGHCLKFDVPTTAYPMQFTGHECFEHRKCIKV